ncbi:alpha/beta-hydrolase [Neocallimastix lanati (nom. inval.)]|uniref:Alpha/beta-hydrolase n=1 Tax=Neocallimastix californiae TaxID=1754190 RepID=A0A1Y2AS27_9FUNG|nr:alpha/beta-hydrolase [Neocallimastix sp. JGI-2020a]ORY25007.1 alpha/beta-hydrolase [Neocallimastix californiae]|eukprot:ORY25007.1 alpha/beta-hydrolase [Neocallimastix californiae]
MVSFRCKIFKFLIRKYFNINPILNQNLVEKIRSMNPKAYKDIKVKGYSFTRKVSDKNTKYMVIKKDSNKPVKRIIYYLHGGAYIGKLNNSYESFTYPFCDIKNDIEVVLLDYDTAPEFKYPTQLNQAIEIWDIITQTCKPEDIIVGGDSSGGNLALALIHKLKKERNIAPRAGIFLSPWTDMEGQGDSYFKNYQKDVQIGETNSPLTKEKYEIIRESEIFCFIGDADRRDPYVSPIYGDFSTFPKSLFIATDNEVLLDDTLAIVDKIKENSNNNVELIVKEGMFHVYPIFTFLPESKEAHKRIINFIRECYN